MAQAWNTYVNTDAYGQDGGFKDNREQVDFKSGRTVYYLKNSKAPKTHAVQISMDDSTAVDGKTEFEWFLYWWENTIKSGTLSFLFPDVITHSGTKEYHMTESPAWKGQKKKEISFKLEEV